MSKDEIEALLNYGDDEKEPVSKGHYVGKSSASFRDFLLKPELMDAIKECAFEHPSQVQQDSIPQALLGSDIICQGKSGMGKTAVFVISILQQIDPVEGEISSLIIAPTRELAYQICAEFNRFATHMPKISNVVLYGGIKKEEQVKLLKSQRPNIVISTPGRLLDLIKSKEINLQKVRYFVIDEVDQVLGNIEMKKDIDSIVKYLPKEKQVMLFSATMPEERKKECRTYTRNPIEVFVDDDKKLTLHGLLQHSVELEENEKNMELKRILESYKFNQLVIFVKTSRRAKALTDLLDKLDFPCVAIHGDMKQQERIQSFREFKDFKYRILVSTDVTARGIDIERVNIVVNYDMPDCPETYLHRVGRAGRFGTKGLAISFVVDQNDKEILKKISDRFTVEISSLPEHIDENLFMNA